MTDSKSGRAKRTKYVPGKRVTMGSDGTCKTCRRPIPQGTAAKPLPRLGEFAHIDSQHCADAKFRIFLHPDADRE